MRFSTLIHHGILGMNARNLLYIKPYNPRKAIALADDKIKAKAFLSARAIPTAKVFAHIRSEEELRAFDFSTLPEASVLKPNFGFGGEGIRVLRGKKDDGFVEGKRVVSTMELREHIEKILEGEYSVNGKEDTAFFEQLLIPHHDFAPFRPTGLPDIRIVVFNLVPVMAMLRIPTAQSGGKANVHLGGIGIGIDLAKGTTTHAVQYNRIVHRLPNGIAPQGIPIPYFREMLLIASKIQQATDIGYLAVDLTVDDKTGPMLLEVNARAGLMVQIANLAPLRARLNRVSGIKVTQPEKGVLLAEELFGTKERRAKHVQEKEVLGLREIVSIPLPDGGALEVTASINTQVERTTFSTTLVHDLQKMHVLETEDETSGTYRTRFMVGGKKIQTIIIARDTQDSGVRICLGRRDVSGFLIDPSKKREDISAEHIAMTMNMHAVDRQLHGLESELPLLKNLKPANYNEEYARAMADEKYQPSFVYADTGTAFDDLEEKLREIRTDTSPFGQLLEKKREELIKRVELLRSVGDNERCTQASIALYGEPSRDLQEAAIAYTNARRACLLPLPAHQLLSAQKAKKMFENAIHEYGLVDWSIVLRKSMVSDCAIGKRHVYIREDAMFEPAHVEALVAHEIEAHALSAENGANQSYLLLQTGCAGYLATQEGLAILLQKKVLPQFHSKHYWFAQSVGGVAYALQNDFASLRQYLQDIGYPPRKALTKALSLKRGMGDTSLPGTFTKDIVYFTGYRALKSFIERKGDLKRLYVGRVALEDLALVEQLPDLKKPILLPKFLQSDARVKSEKKVEKKKESAREAVNNASE